MTGTPGCNRLISLMILPGRRHREVLEILPLERPGPAVEDLHDLRPGLDLGER
jgi:hypothetical protein